MTYTVTCSDPDCQHQFEVSEEYLDLDSNESEPILCPECETSWCWEFDEDADPKLKLTEEDAGDEPDDEDDGFEDGDDDE